MHRGMGVSLSKWKWQREGKNSVGMLHIRKIERNPTTGCASYISLMERQYGGRFNLELTMFTAEMFLEDLVQVNITTIPTLQQPLEIWLSQKSADVSRDSRRMIENPEKNSIDT